MSLWAEILPVRSLPIYDTTVFFFDPIYSVLALGCNPTVAFLGVGNIALYYLVYTKLKRYTWWNTQVGAIVGAIPPLMGYLANTGGEFVNVWWIIPSITLFW